MDRSVSREIAEHLARSRRERVGRDGIHAAEVQFHRLAKLALSRFELGDRDGPVSSLDDAAEGGRGEVVTGW